MFGGVLKAIGGGVDASAGPMSLYRLPGPATASASAETPRERVARGPSMELECAERDLNGLRLLLDGRRRAAVRPIKGQREAPHR